MARYRCFRCRDLRPGRFGEFREWEGDRALCPGCGAGHPAVVELVDVHFLVPDPHGPIPGTDGLRWRLGCQPKREHMAVSTGDTFSCSEDPRAVTCPSCQGLPEFRARAKMFAALVKALAILDGKGGCC